MFGIFNGGIMMKKMLSIDELIVHMKDKGIKFNIVPESDAKNFLSYNNYYLKLASYRANYEKCPQTSTRAGQYQNLDFGYLKELSTIDMYLRYIIIKMCLDIEHAIKVKLVTVTTADSNEDGYAIVKNYLKREDPKFYI